MPYLGRGIDKLSNVEVLDNITFNGSSSYTLQKGGTNYTPSSANNILVSIDGVVQAGNFTVSGSTIDFGTAIAGTSTCDFIIHYGIGLITTPADGTVTTAKLGDSAVTTAKLADSAVSLVKLSATGTKDATTFLRGDNTFASAGESNLPYFYVTRSSNQTLAASTHVLVEYNSVKLDTASGWNNVSYRYIPNVAGKYFFQFVNQSTYSGTAPVNEYSYLRKNGTNVVETSARGNPHGYGSIPQASAILTMNGTTDYIDVTAYGDAGTNYILEGNATLARTYLLGYLISKT